MSLCLNSNAKTNSHIRSMIQQPDLTNVELANKHNVNVKTVDKYKERDFTEEELPLEGIKAQDPIPYTMHCLP